MRIRDDIVGIGGPRGGESQGWAALSSVPAKIAITTSRAPGSHAVYVVVKYPDGMDGRCIREWVTSEMNSGDIRVQGNRATVEKHIHPLGRSNGNQQRHICVRLPNQLPSLCLRPTCRAPPRAWIDETSLCAHGLYPSCPSAKDGTAETRGPGSRDRSHSHLEVSAGCGAAAQEPRQNP